ncbi:hypothetical protein ACFLSQ_04565 [Bacteroidota bacterium]
MKNAVIILLCILIVSCKDNSTEPETSKIIKSTYLHAYDYATNFFFLDTVYKSIYKDYYIYYVPIIPSTEIAKFNRIKEIEVWESSTDIKQGAISCLAVAFADLQAIQTLQGERYSESLKSSPIEMGKVERANWLKMDTTRYTYNRYIGMISIKDLRPERYYGVSYRIEGETNAMEDDWYYGTFSTQTGEKDTLIMKLIYRPNMQPGFNTLWQRQLKNKYYVGEKNIDVSKTEINMYYINANNDTLEYFDGINDKLVTILGVDRFDNATGSQPNDGKFDYRDWTFDKEYGIITFPSIEPFRSSILDYFIENNMPEKSYQYIYHEVYDTTKDVARRTVDKDKYLIVFNQLDK